MKNNPSLLVLLSVFAILRKEPVLAQQSWIWQNPLPQGNNLRAVCAGNASVLYAVGDYGTVLKTTDGGDT